MHKGIQAQVRLSAQRGALDHTHVSLWVQVLGINARAYKSELERRLVLGIECKKCGLEPRGPATNLKKIKEIRQIDRFYVFTWLEVLDKRL